MKKKFSLWINLAVICLCVCSIAIGVYAATSASLTVSGQIGFQAHDCEVEVSMTKMGYALTGGTTYQQTAENIKMDDDNVGKVAGNGGEGTISTVALGELNFTDLAGAEIPDIVLTLSVTNKSAYKVAATVILEDVENLRYSREYNYGATAADTKTAHSGAVILNAKDDAENTSATFTITLKVDDPEENIESLANNLQITANFAKYNGTAPTETINGIEYVGSGTGYIAYTTLDASGDLVIEPFVNGLPVVAFTTNMAMCGTITSLDLPNTITYFPDLGLEGVGGSSLIIPNSVTSLPEAALFGGYYPAGPGSIKLSNAITSIPSRVFAFSNVGSIEIPYSVTSIGDYAFSDCLYLENVTIGKNVTSIGTGAFSGCESLETITVDPQNTAYSSGENNAYLFENSTNTLLAVTKNFTELPEGVINIGANAFYGMTIDTLALPDGMETFDVKTLRNCTINNLIIPASVTSVIRDGGYVSKFTSLTIYGDRVLDPIEIYSGLQTTATVYVPADMVDDYQNAELYFGFTFQPIPEEA